MTASPSLPPFADSITKDGARECGLYLHVPFCLRKCPYCGFFSEIAGPGTPERYVAALLLQLRRLAAEGWPEQGKVHTVFFGGGTPSTLPPPVLAGLLRECRSHFDPGGVAIESSIEVNPATVSDEGLQQLRRAGFNRLSVGVQSFADAELARIGRMHSAADARRAVRAARRAGFGNINLDLMFALPGQRARDWRQTLRAALELAPEHLAVYELTVEEGTPFAGLQEQGKLELPPEEEVLEMMAATAEETAHAGLRRYEISNYARPGRECRHNINYWRNGSYIGLGAGAVSCVAGRRYAAVRDVDLFCRRIETGREPWAEVEELDHAARFRETVIMGLRMTAGISMARLRKDFGLYVSDYYGATLRRLVELDLVDVHGDIVRLTDRGLTLANRVMAELV